MPSAEEYKEQQKNTWNKFSDGWKKWDPMLMDWMAPIGAKVIEKAGLQEGDRVMDMSTGTGEPGLSAAKLIGGGEVVGVDLAEEMLAVAGDKAAALGVANYSTRAYDGLKVPFEDNSFDAVICRFGVIFSPEPVALMTEMVRTLKPGRKMSVSSWGPKEENPWASTAAAGVAKHITVPQPPAGAPGIFRYADPAELKKDMETAGLKSVEITRLAGELGFESAQVYWQYMSEIAAPVASALAGADEDTRRKVGESVVELCGQYLKNGRVSIPWQSFVVSGEK
jgi:ubiquinone/menaquinone biosynthesis C-methylase UbiE